MILQPDGFSIYRCDIGKYITNKTSGGGVCFMIKPVMVYQYKMYITILLARLRMLID